MLSILGNPRRFCDGVTRREAMTVGGLSALGGAFNLPDLLALEERRPAASRPGKAKNVILALPARRGAARRTCSTSSPTRRPRSAASSSRSPPAPRHPDLRAPAATGPLDAPLRHRPLGPPPGRLPQHPAGLHRQRAAGGHQRPDPEATPTRRAWARSASTSSRPASICRTTSPCRTTSAGAGPIQPARAVGAAFSASATTRCAASTSRRSTTNPRAGRRPMWLGRALPGRHRPPPRHDARPPRRPPQPAAAARRRSSAAPRRRRRSTPTTASAAAPSAC